MLFMGIRILDGKTLAKMLICGAKNLKDNVEKINDLNVFPVPDGDTGTNMTMTVDGGIAAISANEEKIGNVMSSFANGVLLGARGNSGVILSQIFAGMAQVFADKSEVCISDICLAFESGVKKSYSAVHNPTEGTILTVFREGTEAVRENLDKIDTVEELLKIHRDAAEHSLARTKEILPILAEADVVDSGGAGYLAVVNGMYSALTGEMSDVDYSFESVKSENRTDIDAFTRDSVLEFGYCTEFLLRLMSAKVDPDALDEKIIVNALTAMGGDSIVAFKTGDVVKVHVHTFTPGEVLAECQKYGEFLTLKIENMALEHSEKTKTKPKKEKPYSLVAVASGEGIYSLFTALGVEKIIIGGQTNNPSAEDFCQAFDACEGKEIIVFPNNKNILLTADQAAKLWTKKPVHIVATKSIPEGYSALSVVTPGITDIEAIVESATRAAEGTLGVQITRAVRSVTLDGREIHEGEYISILGGHIVRTASSAEDALTETLESLDDIDLMELMTIFVGAEISEDCRADLTEKLEELYPDLEITVYEGGQDVYDYLVSIE